MSWAEIKKAINSNISKSLDVLITEKSNEVKTVANNNNSLLNNSTYGLSALQSIISNIKSLLENTTYGLNAIKTTVNSVNNTVSVVGNIPSVKSVQRGKVNTVDGISTMDNGFPLNARGNTYYYDITINSVNMDKSIVFIDGNAILSNSNNYSFTLLNSNTIRLYWGARESNTLWGFTWQVIEFY